MGLGGPSRLRYSARMSRFNGWDVAARRMARAGWPVVVRSLANSTDDDLSGGTDPAQRIGMMWPLAVEAWQLAGLDVPSYTRDNTPSRVIRAGELRGDESR